MKRRRPGRRPSPPKKEPIPLVEGRWHVLIEREPGALFDQIYRVAAPTDVLGNPLHTFTIVNLVHPGTGQQLLGAVFMPRAKGD